MFFTGITLAFLIFLAVVALLVLLASPAQVAPEMVFNKPKVNIDFTVFDSNQFQNLETFDKLETQFSYKAVTKDGKKAEGLISAASMAEARQKLEDDGMSINSIEEVTIGRDNPFTPYYQVAPAQ